MMFLKVSQFGELRLTPAFKKCKSREKMQSVVEITADFAKILNFTLSI